MQNLEINSYKNKNKVFRSILLNIEQNSEALFLSNVYQSLKADVKSLFLVMQYR